MHCSRHFTTGATSSVFARQTNRDKHTSLDVMLAMHLKRNKLKIVIATSSIILAAGLLSLNVFTPSPVKKSTTSLNPWTPSRTSPNSLSPDAHAVHENAFSRTTFTTDVSLSECANCLPALVVFSLLRDDLLSAFLASIDTVTANVIVICNYDSAEKHASLLKITEEYSECLIIGSLRCKNPNIRHLHVVSSRENLGFSGSFNKALKLLLSHSIPYAIFNNDDTIFIPGRLLVAKQTMESISACMFYFEGFSSFGMTRNGMLNLGSMDENFWPAYAEDCDYWYRAQLLNCSLFYRAHFTLDTRKGIPETRAFVTHGDGTLKNSVTYRSSERVHKLVENTLDAKRGRFAYLVKKWGFNVCDWYHEVINLPRQRDEVVDGSNEISKSDKADSLPYGAVTFGVNEWDKDDWRNDGSISPRGVNIRWAPNNTVWQGSDDVEFKSLVENIRLRDQTGRIE